MPEQVLVGLVEQGDVGLQTLGETTLEVSPGLSQVLLDFLQRCRLELEAEADLKRAGRSVEGRQLLRISDGAEIPVVLAGDLETEDLDTSESSRRRAST